jgi:hypothetical protein
MDAKDVAASLNMQGGQRSVTHAKLRTGNSQQDGTVLFTIGGKNSRNRTPETLIVFYP